MDGARLCAFRAGAMSNPLAMAFNRAAGVEVKEEEKVPKVKKEVGVTCLHQTFKGAPKTRPKAASPSRSTTSKTSTHSSGTKRSHPPSDDDDTATKSSKSASRSATNAFQYRMSKAPPAVKQRWKELKALHGAHTDNEDKQDFVKKLLACGKGDYSGVLEINSTREVSKESSKGDESAWISWTKLVEHEGEVAAMELAIHKTLRMRRSKNLPKESCLEWPKDQQFNYNTETESDKQSTLEKVGMKEKAEVDKETAEAFDTCFDKAASSSNQLLVASSSDRPAPRAATAQLPAPLPENDEKLAKKDQAAITSVKKTHSEWDRKKREFTASLVASANCDHTRGTKFESDLKEVLSLANACDENILQYELRYTTFGPGAHFSDKDIVEMAGQCKALVEHIKAGQRYSTLLKSWMKGLTNP